MPYLDINDFRFIKNEKEQNIEKKEETDISVEKVESFYRKEIEKLKKHYQRKLEEEVKKAFEEGYKKGAQEKENQLREKFEEEIKKTLEKEKDKHLQKYKAVNKKFENLINQIRQQYEKRIDYIDELILSALEEILYYMYISPNNLEFLSEEIKKIINQLKNSSSIKLIIPKSLEDLLKDLDLKNVSVEINEELSVGDFIIEFDHVQLETNFKEKIKILKDEIKREIKKYSKI